MEPQENKKIMLGKALNAHQMAEAALNDLMTAGTDPRYAAMVERIHKNIEELRAEAATIDPAQHV